jgi:hypothetical protein
MPKSNLEMVAYAILGCNSRFVLSSERRTITAQ